MKKNIENLGIIYHEKLASQWTLNYQKKSFQIRLKLLRKILVEQVKPGNDWLDAGCGSGVLTKLLLDLGANVMAVDGSSQMIQVVIKDLGNQYSTLNWRHLDLAGIKNVNSKEYDGILCSSVLEYLPEPQVFMQDIFSLIKAEGVLIISVPSKFSLIRFIHKLLRKLLQLFSIKAFNYLSVSKFELDPKFANSWFESFGFQILARYDFDPILPKNMLKIFSPSLLIFVCKRI